MGVAPNSWMVYFMENPSTYKWMKTRGTPHLWKPQNKSVVAHIYPCCMIRSCFVTLKAKGSMDFTGHPREIT